MKKIQKEFKQLELQELETIFVMCEQELSIREIARRCKRSASTIHRVVRSHKHPNNRVWSHLGALARAEYVHRARRKRSQAPRSCKLAGDERLKNYVFSKLIEQNWSPEQIAEKAKQELSDRWICAKTIYTFIQKRHPELIKYLHERGKKRRLRVVHRRGRFKQGAPEIRQIAERPVEVDARSSAEHWEGDLVVSCKKGKGALLSLRERKTRKQVIVFVPDLKAETIRNYLIVFFNSLPEGMALTLTLDRGSEFAFSELKELERLFPRLKIFYCDAYKPSQKGSVENGHRGIRWYFPKGTDFSMVPKEMLDYVETLLNNKPMKLHNFESTATLWEQELELKTAA